VNPDLNLLAFSEKWGLFMLSLFTGRRFKKDGPRPLNRSACAAWILAVAAGAGVCRAATNEVPGLALYLPLDEIRAESFVDLVTTNAIGRAVNVRTTPQGKLNAACTFERKNSYVRVADAPALNPKQFAVTLWFKTEKEVFATRTLLEKGTDRGYALEISGGGKDKPNRGKLRAVVNGRSCLSDAPVVNDAWHHAAAVFDGHTLKLYVDGVLQKQTAAVPTELTPNACDLTLGMNRSAPSAQEKETSLDGALDEVMLFSRALGEAEIKQVMASARPKFTKQQVERRLKELKDLLDRGLILKDFYDRKVQECEVVE